MSLGSTQTPPPQFQFGAGPGYEGVASRLGPELQSLINSGFAFRPYQGQLNAPIDPTFYSLVQQLGGLATGSFMNDQGPYGAAQRTLQSSIETGLPTDISPLIGQGQYAFSNTIAPQIRESLGANYGIRFGTPLGEQLGRAGAEVDLGVKSAALPFMDAAQARRMGAAQFLPQLAGQSAGLFGLLQQLQQAQLDRPYQEFVRSTQTGLQGVLQGLGTLGGSGFGNFAAPQYGPSNDSQNLSALLQLGGTLFGAFNPAAAPVTAAANNMFAPRNQGSVSTPGYQFTNPNQFQIKYK